MRVEGKAIPGWTFCDPAQKLGSFDPMKEESELGWAFRGQFLNPNRRGTDTADSVAARSTWLCQLLRVKESICADSLKAQRPRHKLEARRLPLNALVLRNMVKIYHTDYDSILHNTFMV